MITYIVICKSKFHATNLCNQVIQPGYIRVNKNFKINNVILDGQIAYMQSGNSKVLNQTWGLKLTVVYDDYWQQRFGSRSEER